MKAVLTIQLQQDNGTPVFTGTQTKLNLADPAVAGSVLADFNQINSFLTGGAIKSLLRYFCWVANGQIPTPAGAPSVTILSLGDTQGN
jgi:ABC-type protease/lipase transport system fused ATPase/permease subunit